MAQHHQAFEAARPSPVWVPADTESTRMAQYMEWLKGRGLSFESYHELWDWSTTELEQFWGSIWDYFEVIASVPPREVISSRAMPGAEWFPCARLNFAENVLAAGKGDEVAVISADEGGVLGEMTWDQLRSEVAVAAAGLGKLGVGPGDRVCAMLPNGPEALIAFLATASLGAIWSSAAPETGPDGLVNRFAQIDPKVLIATPAYQFNGRVFDRSQVLAEVAGLLSSLNTTILVPGPTENKGTQELANSIMWTDFMDYGVEAPLEFAQMPFDHPLWILFTSGTTGLPKPLVHPQGGMLLDYYVKLGLHLDVREGDRFFWYTNIGWSVWNMLVSTLAVGSAVVLYNGSVKYPDMGALWDLAAECGVTTFGASPAYLQTCIKQGVELPGGRDLSALRNIGGTGSPMTAELYEWVQARFGTAMWLQALYGCTDTACTLAGPSPLLPAYAGEMQGRCLGVRLEVYDAHANPSEGEVGEIVITQPMPSMPVFFWNDDGSLYRDSYFDAFPGVWRQGDWGTLTDRGTITVNGRSDATINRGGVRIGPSEIYRAVLAEGAVVDALAIDVPHLGAESTLALFVVLKEGVQLDDTLRNKLMETLKTECSPRHVPDVIEQVSVLPLTHTGKRLEVPVRKIFQGVPIEKAASLSMVDHPDALRQFEKLASTLAWNA